MDLTDEDKQKKLIYLACEELLVLLRESGNDEGADSSVAQGGFYGLSSERPREILEAISTTALKRLPLPEVDRMNPVSESTPGYLPMAFHYIFLTGAACPFQNRKRDIRVPATSWEPNYYR